MKDIKSFDLSLIPSYLKDKVGQGNYKLLKL